MDLVTEEICEFWMLLQSDLDFLGVDLAFEPLIGLELLGSERLDGLGDEVVVAVGAIFVNDPNFSPDGCSRASLEELVGVGLGFFLGLG